MDALQTRGRPDSSVDKGSSIVAGIIDLGTASDASGFAFTAIEFAVSGVGSPSPLPSGNEIADHAGEFLRHLIGERYHAS
jgi:hypothetical protein